jgi:NADPH:quinone reductase-like Zn-dependent oxidoreductase/acyl carrier protein
MGEVAAAYVAGALRLEDAARVICVRSGLLRQISGQGAMAVVELAAAEAEALLAQTGVAVVVAALNGPTTTVLAGSPAAIEAVVTTLSEQGVFARRVQVDVASHSPQVEGLRSALLTELAAVEPQAAEIALYSTVRGTVLSGRELDATYWVDNLRQAVQFAPMVTRLLDDGLTCFLEISPHPTLAPAIEQSFRQHGSDAVVLASLRRNTDERLTLLETVGMFYGLGLPIVWSHLYPASGKVLRLPDYPWQRERFWLGDQTVPGASIPRRTAGHPLLGEHVESSLNWGTHFWATELGVELLPYLNDHRVRGQCILPATAYIEMALSAATELFGTRARSLEQIDFKQALTLSRENSQTIQVTLTAQTPGMLTFQCASRQPKENGQSGEWLAHASGTIKSGVDHDLDQALGTSYTELRQRLAMQTGAEHYAAMQSRGLQYGPSFQGVTRVWRQAGEALGQIQRVQEATGPYQIHPALLDSCFQIAIAALPNQLADAQIADTYVPVGIERLHVNQLPGTELWCYARIRPQPQSDDQRYAADLVVLDESDQVLIAVSGLVLQRIEQTSAALSNLFYEIRWQQADSFTALPEYADWRGKWLIFANSGSTLTATLEAFGGTCVVVRPGSTYDRLRSNEYQIDPTQPEHFRQLLADAFSAAQPCRGVIHLWALQTAIMSDIDVAALEQGVQLGLDSVLHLIQALNDAAWTKLPRLWLVTRGSQAVTPGDAVRSIIQAPLWGLGRTIQHEHPDLTCTRIDLGLDLTDEDQAILKALLAPDNELELALRADGVYVSRLVHRAAPEDSTASPEPAGDRPFRLEISRAGTLDQLQLRAFELREPGPDEVLIEVWASGLNFRDVLKTLGMYPGLDGKAITLGDECAGTIVAIGSNVTDVQIGDAVVAVATHSFGTHVIANAQLVAPKPARMSFEEAATIPIAFLTAAYALEYLGRISSGERVLIHAAAGGVGLAAVQLAQAAGAEIFATAGNDTKRSFLRSLGVQHVLDSRSLAFADQVFAETNGEGVDVVLNSLSGDFIPNSMAILAPYGRFLEIGKRDIYQNRQIGLEPFRRNLAFFAIDLERMFVERPKLIGSLLRQIVGRVAAGELQPLPMQIFPIADVDDAFHMMEQARHIGKIVVSVTERETVPIAPAAHRSAPIRADATYLITGGFGGLGLSVAQWLADQGARQVVLVGRSGAPASAQPAIDVLSRAGVNVVALAADVTRSDDVTRVLTYIRQHLPPLRGVIHAVGILDDGILLQQSAQRFRTVVQPKVDGAWNLHAQTLGATDTPPLDFFVLFSSVTSVLGSPGQSNYAAANAFLDALAHARRAAGLPALSINWCPWSAVGMAARLEQRGQQALRGLRAITPQQGVMALGALLREDTAQVGVMSFNAAEWIAAYPASAHSNQLALLATSEPEQPATTSVRDSLLAVEPGRRRRIALETYVREQVSHVLRLAPSRIGITTPLRNLGFDSLMSLELRNRLEAGLQLSLSASLTWNYPTIEVLVPYLAERMQIPLDATDREPAPVLSESSSGNAANLNDELSQLSAEDLEMLLLQELEDLDL